MFEYNIFYKNKAKKKIYKYIEMYKNYYFELYKDSGIWSEKVILENYNLDSKKKTDEIYECIKNKLKLSFIKYPDNTAIIKWKTRFIIVYFYDEDKNRIISDLEIK